MPSITTPIATFEELALPLLVSLYNHAHWLAGNHGEAEDLVQETLFKAIRAFHSFEPSTNFKAWIFCIPRVPVSRFPVPSILKIRLPHSTSPRLARPRKKM